jgi:adenylylsulfate kinase
VITLSNLAVANIVWHSTIIDKEHRQQLKGHKSGILWLTGLSGSGKSTLANALEQRLFEMGIHSYLLDGDNIRHGLNNDLGFSPEDRKENIRRIGETAKLFADAGILTITAFISPYQADRDLARSLVDDGEFIEVYVKCSIEECENRDPKGLYKKAREGKIPEFTGISSPYEEPEQAELLIESDKFSIDESVDRVIQYLRRQSIIA